MRARALSSFILLSLLAISCGPSIPSGIVLTPKGQNGQTAGPRVSILPVAAIDWERQPLLVADPNADQGPPISLTAGDGSGLQIASIDAKAAIQDPLAFTEIHFVFKNPEPRAIEGRFEITLPPGATVSRFAMKQAFGWQEGEVVELQAAREAYEDALHRRVDPALLEKQAGNRFQARVFPIPASGEKEIIFSYSQELTRARDPYRLYLRGLPEVGSLDLRVILDKPDLKDPGAVARQALEVHKRNFKPDRDLAIPLPPAAEGVARGLRHEELAVARVTPIDEARPDKIDSLLVLFDTSASRALGFKSQVDRLGRLVEAIQKASGPDMLLAVVAFDQDADTIFNGKAKEFGKRELSAILDRKPLGASDLGKALRFASKIKATGGGRLSRALLMTDGIATAGEGDAKGLADDIASLKLCGVDRLDALVDGGIRDEALLKQLAVGALAKNGVVLDAALSTDSIAERLRSATSSGIKVNVPGAEWVWPSELNGFQPGDQAVIFAVVPKEAPFEIELAVGDSKQKQVVRASTVERPLLERAAVNAHIHRLMDDRNASPDEAQREQVKQRILDLSTRYRVLSDFTALLVLDNDEDYARFHINRTALADILTVGPDGVELMNRKSPSTTMIAAPSTPEKPTETANASSDDDSGGEEAEKKTAESSAQPAMQKPADAPMGGAPDAKPKADKGSTADIPPPPPPRPAPEAPGAAPMASAAPAMAAPAKMAPRAAPNDPLSGLDEAPAPMTPRPRSEPSNDNAPAQRPATSAPRPGRSSGPRAGGASRPVARDDVDNEAPFERPQRVSREPPEGDESGEEEGVAPYEGRFRDVMAKIAAKKAKEAIAMAMQWREDEPGDALAFIALGEAFEALGDKNAAARAYGSIIDLFPSRADLRRFAGARLERLGGGSLELAVDTFQKAEEQRPDHPASHRMLAYALLRSGKMSEAFEAILNGLRRQYPEGRFAGVQYILFEDIGLIAAAWIKADPSKKQEILARLAKMGVPLPTKPSLRFVLNWETDANDVDFHIHDGRRGHAYYAQPALRSGGELYADVTTGYGPECFTIEGRPRAYPYKLQAHYYSRGPMGYGMGKLEILEHDGQGGLKFDERPFVVMTDRAFVDLGVVSGPLKDSPK